MRTDVSEENIGYWLKLHGHVPWTMVIADALERGIPWDNESVVKTLRQAQHRIDELAEELKEKQ